MTISAIVVVWPCSHSPEPLKMAFHFSPQACRSSPADPSNALLASPAIERRVDDLLKQMTLEEKIGQLVQYGGDG